MTPQTAHLEVKLIHNYMFQVINIILFVSCPRAHGARYDLPLSEVHCTCSQWHLNNTNVISRLTMQTD